MELFYQIALTSVWWNDDYKDVRRFSSFDEQKTYFDLENIFLNAPRVNFDIKDLLKPRITFKESNKDVFEVLNANYLIVKDNHTSSVQKYFFYFINTIRQDSGDIYIADCKLDVWQTFHLIVDFGSGLIERAHLNRFFQFEEDGIEFDFRQESPLLITENPSGTYDKLLKAEQHLVPIGLPTNVAKWCDDYILCWAYVFLDNSAKRKFYVKRINGTNTLSDVQAPNSKYCNEDVEERYSVLCFPVMKNYTGAGNPYKASITIHYGVRPIGGTDHDQETILGFNALKNFLANNNGYAYIHNIVFSAINPLTKFNQDSALSFSIVDGALEVNNTSVGTFDDQTGVYYVDSNKKTYILRASESDYDGAFLGIEDIDFIQGQILHRIEPLGNALFGLETMSFYPSDIVGAQKNILFEPKLRQPAYTSMAIDMNHIAEKPLSLIQYDPTNITVNAYFSTSPASNETKLMPRSQKLGIKNNDFALSISSDLSIPIINSQLENYIANNKSWARIGYINSQSEKSSEYGDIVNIKGFASLASIKSLASPGSIVSTALTTSIDADFAKSKPGDLKAAPSDFRASVSEVFRIGFEDQIKFYIRYFQVPRAVLERDFDYYYWFGYSYSYYKKFTDILDDSNRRKYFNFIQGRFLAISGQISDEARRELSIAIAGGVRIWEVDKPSFDDSLENYEVWLESIV